MKQYMKYIMTMALLLTTIGAWAEQNVTITVTPSATAGTVTQKIENGTCTLTVTPASGYYLTVENLTAMTTLDGSGVQGPRRATDIEFKSEAIEVTALDATADPSRETKYTFTMPEDESISVEVSADFQALIAITPTVTLQGWTYGAEPNVPVVGNNPGNGEVTYTYAVKGSTTFTSNVPENAGNYTVKASVAAARQYAAGEATADFSIGKAAITDVTLENSSLTYTGEEQTVEIASVKAGELELTADDYDVSGNTATNKGTYTVTVTAKENSNFSGSKTATFTIAAMSIEGATVTVDATQAYTYTGSEIKPGVTVSLYLNDELTTLTTDDYTVSYANNINAALATDNLAPTVTVTGKGNYTGSASATFTIGKAEITEVVLEEAVLPYCSEEQTPTIVKVMAGDLEVGSDYYEITSGNEKKDVGEYELVVSAKTMEGNNFKGSATVAWSIVNRTITLDELGIGENQTMATYYNTEENLSLPVGLIAYYITGVEGATVTTQRLSMIPKNTPVLVEMATSSATAVDEATDNQLVGAADETDVTKISGTVYVLYKGEFVKSTSGKIPANRAYLVLNSLNTPQRLAISRDNDATGIQEMEDVRGMMEDVWYSLDGQKLQKKPTKKGIYIVNGKKTFVNNK